MSRYNYHPDNEGELKTNDGVVMERQMEVWDVGSLRKMRIIGFGKGLNRGMVYFYREPKGLYTGALWSNPILALNYRKELQEKRHKEAMDGLIKMQLTARRGLARQENRIKKYLGA
jgi:hypothetical protein